MAQITAKRTVNFVQFAEKTNSVFMCADKTAIHTTQSYDLVIKSLKNIRERFAIIRITPLHVGNVRENGRVVKRYDATVL